MSESRSHIDLVKIAYNYIIGLVPSDRTSLVQYDSADSAKPTRVLGNFIPDVFYASEDMIIIGEAKTTNDFDRDHSYSQYASYLEECQKFPGNSYLIISVPWSISLTAKNYFRRIKSAENFDTHIIILNELGRFAEL